MKIRETLHPLSFKHKRPHHVFDYLPGNHCSTCFIISFPRHIRPFHQSLFLGLLQPCPAQLTSHLFNSFSCSVHLFVGNSQNGWMSGLIRGEEAACHLQLSSGNQKLLAWRKEGKGCSSIGDCRSVTWFTWYTKHRFVRGVKITFDYCANEESSCNFSPIL